MPVPHDLVDPLVSTFEIEEIDPLEGSGWDDLVTVRPDHSIFHRAAWARVLSDTYGHKPVYLKAAAAGVPVALIPIMEVRSAITGCRGVSLPFSDFAGPLWLDRSHSGRLDTALGKLAAERKWKHLEIRGNDIGGQSAAPATLFRAHELDLTPGAQAVEGGLCPSVRRSIRKAERSGLTITTQRDSAGLGHYYWLHCRTRRRHGLPPQSFGFFQAIGRHLMEKGLGETVLAWWRGSPVAGAVFLHSGRRAVYKFGASDQEHWGMRPNHLVMWTAISNLIERGFNTLHFGRTADDDEGLDRFKLSWGSKSFPLGYHRLVSSTFRIGKNSVATRAIRFPHPLVFACLPIQLNRLAGRWIYPHLD